MFLLIYDLIVLVLLCLFVYLCIHYYQIYGSNARLVTGATKYERMTPVLRSLHWLPVRQRITFKTAVTVYKCLHGLAPLYLTEYCTTTSDTGRRHLRSANMRQLVIPRTRTSYGDRSFSVRGPTVWNSLPYDLRSTDTSLNTFKNKLKTFLFDSDAN